MNNKFVVFALLASMFLGMSFSSVIAQETSANCDESIGSTPPKYPSYFNSDGCVEKDTIVKRFDKCLSSHFDSIVFYLESDKAIDSFVKDFLNNKVFRGEYVKVRDGDKILDGNTVFAELKLHLINKINKRENQEIEEKAVDKWRLVRIIALVGCIILLAFLIKIAFRVFGKENRAKHSSTIKVSNSSQAAVMPTPDDNAGIEVRRVTTSVLRKQSLDDVIGDDNYLVIEGKDFCDFMAVRKMYVKNECIKGIYNMYAEDIRKSDCPNENGCMVIGRWVYDSDSGQYDVSLEELVFPGNDAVFSQYEMNFGAKITLKKIERLQCLREETDLQYDVTCWVHSHPNLGVFFSNSDCNVQMQLKHPTHPNFLTAIVVDILTPTQELGIFTFQKDGTINTKAELKRLYSLKEWYNWAVESERNFNTLSDTQKHDVSCHAIFLSNNVILDMNELAYDSNDGTIRLILGTTQQNANGETECVADKLSEVLSMPNDELVGAFVADLYCSIPSVRKAVADYLDKIKFVLVYSSSNKMLSSILVVDNDLCEDISYYGEQNLEDLIKWTRKTN